MKVGILPRMTFRGRIRGPVRRRVLAWSYAPLRLARAIGRPLGLSSSRHLRVLLYHDVAPQDQERFAAQLRWLSRRWTFVSPQRFGAMISGEEPIHGPNLLLTFDDGFASNRVVAEQILNPMGVRALFFVVSDFVDLEDRLEARHFIARHIYPAASADALPDHWYNMGWADLAALQAQGHTVGAHTRTHLRLAQLATRAEQEREIVGSGDALERRLGARVDHFAYSFGDLPSFSQRALAVARRRFRFVYSGLRGDNAVDVSPGALRRDAATPQDSTSLLGALLEGAADYRYARSRAQLDAWNLSISEVAR